MLRINPYFRLFCDVIEDHWDATVDYVSNGEL